MKKVLHNSYTMCTRGSPDIYILSPRACGLLALGVYIRQTTCAHGITIKYNMHDIISCHIYHLGISHNSHLYTVAITWLNARMLENACTMCEGGCDELIYSIGLFYFWKYGCGGYYHLPLASNWLL